MFLWSGYNDAIMIHYKHDLLNEKDCFIPHFDLPLKQL